MFQGVYLDRHYVIDKLRVVAARGNEGFATVMNHYSATQNIRIEGSINQRRSVTTNEGGAE
jgi:acetolactate synthase regulatory subunit